MSSSHSAKAAGVLLTREQDFALLRLANEAVEVAVVPELGAKLLSLRNVRSGREWLWRPPGPLRLFRSALGADFGTGTRAGADECLPTIGACEMAGRTLPDHGELWTAAWEVDQPALARGILRTTIQLPVSPLFFERAISLVGSAVQLDYALTNRSGEPQPYLWALHPLLTFLPEDRLELPTEVSSVRVEAARQPEAAKGARWAYPQPQPGVDLARLQLLGDQAYAKFFAGPLRQGQAAIVNDRTGDKLAFSWDPTLNPYVGIWLTRGGWQGFHHPAIEPTNAPTDALTEVETPGSHATLQPHEKRVWRVTLTVSSSAV